MTSLILLSAGLDSLVNLRLALDKTKIKQVITFSYGQKSAPREITQSQKICQFYQLPHQIIRLPWLGKISSSPLTRREQLLPQLDFSQIEDVSLSKQHWVPNRNAIFLNIAAAVAESKEIDLIIFGANQEEGRSFPDNTSTFIRRINALFKYSLQRKVRVKSWTVQMEKKEIARQLKQFQIPLHFLWSCYEGNKLMCGCCLSCLRLKRALSPSFPRSKISPLFLR